MFDSLENIAKIETNDSNEIIILDNGPNSVLTRVTNYGAVLKRTFLSEHVSKPSDFTSHENKYFVTDLTGNKIIGIGDDGFVFLKFSHVNASPLSIQLDSQLNILVSDRYDSKFNVYVYTSRGILQKKFRTEDKNANGCSAIQIMHDGSIFSISKTCNYNNVLKFSKLRT